MALDPTALVDEWAAHYRRAYVRARLQKCSHTEAVMCAKEVASMMMDDLATTQGFTRNIQVLSGNKIDVDIAEVSTSDTLSVVL